MIESIVANPHQTSPFRHGNILFAGVTTYKNNPPGIGRCLSQGAAVGAFIGFLSPVIGLLSHPTNGYNYLLVFWLPMFLAFGICFGVLEGTIIWACGHIVGHRLHAVPRAVLGVVSLAIILVIYSFLWAEPLPQREYLRVISIYVCFGALFGLVIGSRLEPVSELLRGTSPPQLLALTGITGLSLRVLVIFGLMESVLNLIFELQWEPSVAEFSFAVIALGHFLAAAVIIFVRMPFWLLLPLAVIVNFPIAAFITDMLTEQDVAWRNISIVYLCVWGAFLLTRLHVPERALNFVKQELRYYLID
jgi:hypothetical protein